MTGVFHPTVAPFEPRRSGTQDYIHLDPDFPWKPGEIADLQVQIAVLSRRPIQRVRYVVSLKPRFDEPFKVLALRSPFLGGWNYEMREYIGQSRCAKRTDWMICRAAMEIFAHLQPSWHMRKLSAAKKVADTKRLPLRVRRGTGWEGNRKYRGIYTIVAEQFGTYCSYVRDVGLGKKANAQVLEALYRQVAIIDQKAKGVAA